MDHIIEYNWVYARFLLFEYQITAGLFCWGWGVGGWGGSHTRNRCSVCTHYFLPPFGAIYTSPGRESQRNKEGNHVEIVEVIYIVMLLLYHSLVSHVAWSSAAAPLHPPLGPGCKLPSVGLMRLGGSHGQARPLPPHSDRGHMGRMPARPQQTSIWRCGHLFRDALWDANLEKTLELLLLMLWRTNAKG